MEEIYINAKHESRESRILTNQPGPRSSERRFHGAVVLSLSLLSVLLLAGIIVLGVHLHGSAAELSIVKANLTERIRISDDKFSSLTEERDLLKAKLAETTKDWDRLQRLFKRMHCSAAELSTVKAILTERIRISDDKFSSLTEKRDLLKATLAETTNDRDRLQRLSKRMNDSAAEFSIVKANLTERIRISDDKFSSLTEERDLLKAKLAETTKYWDRLQRLSKRKKTCPEGWRMFSCTCYFISTEPKSWEQAREDCRAREADLVIIDSPEEQTFLSGFISTFTWIGLSDREEEGVWKWVDGTPLNLTYWAEKQPDNGGGDPKFGEEDCAHLGHDGSAHWNDMPCGSVLRWICEEMA
ncbi:asialoglycoprotein receptor 1-like [Seriola aureovittata]|uniref:asialoglycoprotein receptor 1-like n=1 Tax=Seriola aureovittata TaxID=2871759 RepID=UPI0024BE80AA|nr:asialoglycoprotein receptor 1-like [Seriola aureovittata]